jgi:hypothetical protein
MSTDTETSRKSPAQLAVLARYEVKGVKGFDASDGYAFTATIHRDGKKFLVVEQSGRGGSNMYHSATRGKPGEWREQVKTLQEDAKAYTGEDYTEVEDTFVGAMLDAFEERKWLMGQTRGAKRVMFQVDDRVGGPSWQQFPNLRPGQTPKAVEAAKARGSVVRVVWREGKALKDEVFGK